RRPRCCGFNNLTSSRRARECAFLTGRSRATQRTKPRRPSSRLARSAKRTVTNEARGPRQRADANVSSLDPHGQLTISGSVPRKRAPLLTALGFSLPAGQQREPERRPARPGRAPPSVLCANAVPAPATLADAQTLGKTGRKRQRPRGSLLRAAVEWCLPRSSRRGGSGSSAWTR